MDTTSRSTRSKAGKTSMNSIEWLKSVREKGQKPHIPPDPPEGTPGENGAKPLISPDPSCSSLYFLKNRNILETGVERKNISVIEEKVKTSGGSGGILRFYRGNDELRHRRDRRNQENFDDFEEDVNLEAWRDPFFTSGGDLSIPFGRAIRSTTGGNRAVRVWKKPVRKYERE